VFSLTAERYPKGGTAMFGILAIFGDLGCSFGPWLAGLVSDYSQKSVKLLNLGAAYGLRPEQLGLKSGMLIATVFPLIMILGILGFKQKDYSK
jgi:MFS family permease